MPATYEPIATTTLTNTSSVITFNNIPSTYTDIRINLICLGTSGAIPRYYFNNDTSALYSNTYTYGNGSIINTGYNTSASACIFGNGGMSTTVPQFYTADIFSYTSTSYFKTSITSFNTDNNGSGRSGSYVNLYRSTSAITRIDLDANGSNFNANTIATLYGIKAS